MSNTGERITLQDRRRGAILGMYIGDALAMPVHWYYDRDALKRDYGTVTDYLPPAPPHPDSILWRTQYTPLNSKAEILHDQAPYWGQIGIHYHQFLKAGENTLNLKLCTLLIHSLNRHRGYNTDDYLQAYITYMQTSGNHRDTYVEEYHRHFFKNLAMGKRPRYCGVPEKHISGVIGMTPIAAYYAQHPEVAREAAVEHLALTHLGPRMEAAGSFLLDVLLPVLGGTPLKSAITAVLQARRNPLLNHPLDTWLRKPDETVVGGHIGTACYVEDAVPAIAYLALKYGDDTEKCLVANTNLGGDNAGRGAILGALLGAANQEASLPERWVSGLRQPPPDLVTDDEPQ